MGELVNSWVKIGPNNPISETEVEAAKAIKPIPAGAVLGIDGHTDDVGGAEMNQRLSEARANAVRDFLVKQGVKADALVAKGYGETTPVASNATPEGRFENRRMEYEVVK